MFYIGQLVKVIYDPDEDLNKVGILLGRKIVKPSNRKEEDEYYVVLCPEPNKKEPFKTWLFPRENLFYAFHKDTKKAVFGKTITKKRAVVGVEMDATEKHENEIKRSKELINLEL